MDAVEHLIKWKRTPISDCHLDVELFNSIYEDYYKRVYNYIRYRVADHFDTDDLVSTVFEKVMLNYGGYKKDRSPLEGWIIGIARNVIADHYRAIKKQNNISLDSVADLISPEYQPEHRLLLNETDLELVKALGVLNEKERDIVAIKFTTDLKNIEIASVIGTSESNVGTIVYRAMKKLHQELERKGYR